MADDDLLGKDLDLRWELAHEMPVKSNPEGLVFGPADDWLAFTTRNDNHLKYIMLPSSSPNISSASDTIEPYSVRKFNLNPNGDDHVSFSILYVP